MSIEKIIDADTLEIFLCLNQALVPIDRLSGRKFCTNCVMAIHWTQSASAGYLLWDSNFITGRWDCKRPEFFQSAYTSDEIQQHYQRLISHPLYQTRRFMEEAALKFKTQRHKLEDIYGKEVSNQIETSFVEILDSLDNLREVLPKYEGANCTYYAIIRKGQSIARRYCFKLKNLIKLFQPMLDRYSSFGPRYDLLDHHLPELPYRPMYQKKQNLESDDSDDSDIII